MSDLGWQADMKPFDTNIVEPRASSREQRITERMRGRGVAAVGDLASDFDAIPQTIRRGVNRLSALGLLRRVVTNRLRVVFALAGTDEVGIIVAGGTLRAADLDVAGEPASRTFSASKTDSTVLGKRRVACGRRTAGAAQRAAPHAR